MRGPWNASDIGNGLIAFWILDSRLKDSWVLDTDEGTPGFC